MTATKGRGGFASMPRPSRPLHHHEKAARAEAITEVRP